MMNEQRRDSRLPEQCLKAYISGIGVKLWKPQNPTTVKYLVQQDHTSWSSPRQLLTGNQIFRCLRLRKPLIQTTTHYVRKCLKQKEGKSSGFGVCVYKHKHMCAIVCIWRSEDSFRCWSLLLLCLNQVSVGFGLFSCICQVSWPMLFRVFPVSTFCFSVAIQGWHIHALQHPIYLSLFWPLILNLPVLYPLNHLSKPKKQFLLKILAFSLK